MQSVTCNVRSALNSSKSCSTRHGSYLLKIFGGQECNKARSGAKKRVVRKLSTSCRREIVAQCNSERFQDLNPHEIVPMLLNEGRYLGSVSTFYRVLKAENLVHHRSNTKPRNGCGKPQEQLATASDQVYAGHHLVAENDQGPLLLLLRGH